MKSAKIVIAVIGISGVALAGLIIFQNKTYTSKVFVNTVAYDKVLASRQWHWQTFGCTYAIVSLKEAVSHYPPDSWLGNETWSKTPVRLTTPIHHDDTTNPISFCAKEGSLSSDVADRLQAAVRDPGSYYIHLGENLLLYSGPQKIAAVVRYGD
jgi:hypothetical protein